MVSPSDSRTAVIKTAAAIDGPAVATWFLGFGLVTYLGLRGGGYDPLVHDQIGIAVWWVVALVTLIGAFPKGPLDGRARLAIGLFGAFVLWTTLSLLWTESDEKTLADAARVATYLGIFVLAILVRDSQGARRMVAAVGTAIAAIAAIALLSRLYPTWFSDGSQTAQFIGSSRERLSYPLDYWNALGALMAVGLPLLLHTATNGRLVARGLGGAALPLVTLTLFFTLSRSGTVAAIVGIIVCVAVASRRLAAVAVLAIAVAGSAVLVIATVQREALQKGLDTAVAHRQGDELLVILIAVCAGAGMLTAGLARLDLGRRLPSARFTTQRLRRAAVAASITIVCLCVALGVPGKLADAWRDFKQPTAPGAGPSRLASAAGDHRYEFWQATVEENSTAPVSGTGSGTFEYWWARNGTSPITVRDAHSLYFQTFGELGVVGLLLLVAFLLTVIMSGFLIALRSSQDNRASLAAALGGAIAFCVTAAFDWVWQIPVLPVVFALLASVLLTDLPSIRPHYRLPISHRAAFLVGGLAAVVVIAVPLASTSAVRDSQAAARAGDIPSALQEARTAQSIFPDAASPHLQEALLLEAQGAWPQAAEAALAATERESTNWRNWLVLARVEASRGNAEDAIRYYLRAKSLNPNFSFFPTGP